MGIYVIAFILMAFGLIGIIFTQKKLNKVKESQVWSLADGKIEQSEVSYNEGRIGKSSFTTTGGTNIIYESKIEYSYTVEGKNLKGSTICIGGELEFGNSIDSGEDRAQKRCDKYPVGSQVTVYFNPHNPSQCCLERRSEGAHILIGVSILFIICSILMIIFKNQLL